MLIYVDLREGDIIEAWGTSPLNGNSTSVEIEEGHPFLDDIPNKYYLKDGKIEKSPKAQEVEMSFLRNAKKEQLSNECNQDILNGFDYIIDDKKYHFSYDRESQANFQERWQLFQNNMIESMNITAHKNGEDVRLEVDKDLFSDIYMQSVMIKENKIKKLREDLYPLVDKATSQEDLNNISWSTEVIEPKPESIVLKDEQTLDKEIKRVESDNAVSTTEIMNLIVLTNMMGGGMGL